MKLLKRMKQRQYQNATSSLGAKLPSEIISEHAKIFQLSLLLLLDDCQPQKTEDPVTSDVQAVPVQTMLLLSCADFKNISYDRRLWDNSPTNQLAVSQVADWSTRGLVDSPTAILFKSRKDYTIFFTLNLNLTLTLTLSTIESVQLCNLPQITLLAIIYCKF